MKIRLLGAELFYADGQSDRRLDRQAFRHDKANIRFSQFCKCA